MSKKKNNYTTDHARRLGYRSGFEADVAAELESYKLEYEYETLACSFFYETPVVNGVCNNCEYSGGVVKLRKYTCDFCIYVPDAVMFIETKGRFTASDRTKMAAVVSQAPNHDIRILFQYDGKATPKRSYTEWCAWKGIKCAVIDKKNKRYIPREWLEELGVTDK